MVREIQAKAALTKTKLPLADYCMNPYIGCTHGCTYCYAAFMRRFTGHGGEDWGSFVDARVNIVELLTKEVARGIPAGTLAIGSVTDAYQPAERRYGLTRALLQVLTDAVQLRVSILTKSSLIARDIDVFRRLEGCTVGVTVTTLEISAAAALEPRASSPAARLAALSEIHQAGVRTYVFVGPVIPGVTDVQEVIAAAAPCADEVRVEALNVRGASKGVLLPSLAKVLGDGAAARAYETARSRSYWPEVTEAAREACRSLGLPEPRLFAH